MRDLADWCRSANADHMLVELGLNVAGAICKFGIVSRLPSGAYAFWYAYAHTHTHNRYATFFVLIFFFFAHVRFVIVVHRCMGADRLVRTFYVNLAFKGLGGGDDQRKSYAGAVPYL